jgi:hypothetical protein
MKESLESLMKLGCNCIGCGCSRWFWISAPIWIIVGMVIGYWWIDGSPDIGGSTE